MRLLPKSNGNEVFYFFLSIHTARNKVFPGINDSCNSLNHVLDTVWSSCVKRRARTHCLLHRQCLGCPPNVAEEILKLNSVKQKKNVNCHKSVLKVTSLPEISVNQCSILFQYQ